MTIAKPDFIEGIAKGMAVLESFDTERQRLNATLAAERAGLTRAAARRHLLTLAHLGYLETDGSYFWMAPKVLRFSGSYLASSRLPRALQPTLNRLAAQTGESFSAVVLDGEEVVIVARSGSYGAPTARAGLRPASGGAAAGACHLDRPRAAGRAEPGAVDAMAQGPHAAAPDATHRTQARVLRQRIAQVRKEDCCFASEEHEVGVQALAVPLRDMQGRTVAALNVVLSGRLRSEDARAARPAAAAVRGGARGEGAAVRLLLVEDDMMIGEAVLDLLRAEHYAVDWVKDGDAWPTPPCARRTTTWCCSTWACRAATGSRCCARCARASERMPVLVATARDAVAAAHRRARCRRRRLRAQALRPRRAAGPHPRAAAPRRRPRRAGVRAQGRDASTRPRAKSRCDGEPVALSAREWAVLEPLLARPGMVLSRAQLEEKLYSWKDEVSSNAVEVYIHGLRKKLGADLIRNVRGVGYMVPKA